MNSLGSRQIQNVGIIGGGVMGCGIALEFALAGRTVTLFNTRPETSQRVHGRIERDLTLLLESGLVTAAQASAALARLRRTTVLAEAISGQDYLSENVPEDLALKQQVFQEMDRLAPPDVLLTSNTSALSVTALALRCTHPERVLSVHYYQPAHLIPLVDVIPGERTAPEALQAARRLMEALGKEPVVFARDVPGSVGPRLQAALVGEALRIVQEGVATPEMVDRILTQSVGRRLGVTGIFERLDLAGLDTVVAILRGAGRPVPSLLAEKMERGELGLKSGRGFYVWTPEAIAAFEERVARHLSEQLRKDRARGQLPTPPAEEEP
ncbi:3-hydroxyacyl-CoA dehydrogenase family protein [Hyalangium sp.]|uniref:3-hydroxyacyl-CoA dehydrogenase family protein n=1 Tax=Hyalangium sp. TaxID=2028555 RepID=UPI002D4D89A1|nr:3-hydroxyacyl-CoA dehydrogenase family protein [Hyalangium sp.]HYH98759.1 3-hydroxyacyl-CoA dehydrogenase family protein [Hyalangium sp.]